MIQTRKAPKRRAAAQGGCGMGEGVFIFGVCYSSACTRRRFPSQPAPITAKTSTGCARLLSSRWCYSMHSQMKFRGDSSGSTFSSLTLIGAESPDIVILQAYWSDADTIETIRPTIDALRANNIANIVILGSVPVWHGGLPGVVASFFRLNGSVIPPRVQQYVDPNVGESSMLEIASTLGVKYISARDAFCNADGCLTRASETL